MMVRRWMVAIMLAATAATAGCGAAAGTPSQAAAKVQAGGEQPAKAAYSTMSAQELQAEMNAGDKALIVDLREPELYRAGHIPGATNIPFEQFNDRMKELDPKSDIVLVCHTGPMGEVSGTLMGERGYTSVRNLRGGMAAWSGRLEK